MLSERNHALVERVVPLPHANAYFSFQVSADTLNRLLDAARAEGGAGEGLASGSLGSGSTAPPEAISPPPPPGGVEELVASLRRASIGPLRESLRPKLTQAADALLSQARLLEAKSKLCDVLSEKLERRTAEVEERTRERDTDDRLLNMCAEAGAARRTAEARAETAERLLEEVVGALSDCERELSFSVDRMGRKGGLYEAARNRARQALSIVRKEKGSSQGCPTSSAPPFANQEGAP